MHKATLAVDIDDVLIATTQLIAEALGGQYGTNIPPYYTKDRGLRSEISHISGRSFEVVSRDMHAYLLSEVFQSAEPIKGSVNALRALSNRFEIAAITARSRDYRDPTRAWINRHFHGAVTDIYFPNAGEMTHGGRLAVVDKTNDLRALNAEWLIDDKIEHLLPLTETDTRGLLFGDYPWNQADVLPSNIKRSLDWDEVLRII